MDTHTIQIPVIWKKGTTPADIELVKELIEHTYDVYGHHHTIPALFTSGSVKPDCSYNVGKREMNNPSEWFGVVSGIDSTYSSTGDSEYWVVNVDISNPILIQMMNIIESKLYATPIVIEIPIFRGLKGDYEMSPRLTSFHISYCDLEIEEDG